MPELPEVETIARELHERLAGRAIVDVRVIRPDILRQTDAVQLASACHAALIVRVWRRAKSVVVELSGKCFLVIQPRFTGSVQIDEPLSEIGPDPYSAVEWDLADGGRFRYRDVRRLGTVTLFDADGLQRYHERIGDEPLDPAFTADRLSVLLRGSKSAIKRVLMDQGVLAGVGNIYANEVLWIAGIDPSRAARSISSDEVRRLHGALIRTLLASIAARGTTFRDYRDPSNRRGAFATQLKAYGRGGASCERCRASLVETHEIDGRSTVFCYRCQR